MIEAAYVPLSDQLEWYIMSGTDIRFTDTDTPFMQFYAPLSEVDRRILDAHATEEGKQLVEELLTDFSEHRIAWIALAGQTFTAYSTSREFPEIRQDSIKPTLKEVVDTDVELISSATLSAKVFA